MGRVRSLGMLLIVCGSLSWLTGCGSKTAAVAVKTLRVSPSVTSLEQGTYTSLSVTDNNGTSIAASRLTWQASNPAAVTVAILSSTPTMCAGTWDSLTNPTICTPGPAVEVQLTASADGATSAPISVFVHQHIERLVTSALGPGVCPQNPPPPPALACLSGVSVNAPACFANYQVLAYNNGVDITSTIGPINWAALNGTIVSLSTTASGLLFNQVQATARIPGQTQFSAFAGNATSTSVPFATCPVDTITLATAAGGNSLTLAKGSVAQTITATVLDTAGLQMLNPPLTWSSTNPTVASVSSSGVIAGLQTGGAGVTASCIPATCNIGFTPTSAPLGPPVYPSNGISVQVTGTASASTAFVTSSGCWDRVKGPVLGCISSIIPIPQSTNKPGAPITLPHTPTSMMISASGSNIYVGSCVPRVQNGPAVCNGIAVVAGTGAVATNNAITGDVVGVSVAGNKAVVSDTSTTPNQVFLYDQPTNSGTQLLLATTDHAKSAVFSPDGFQAYIATYQCTALPCQASNEIPGPVYVFDALNNLRILPTPAKITDIAFHPSGAFVYMAGIAADSLTVFDTCNNLIAKDPNGVQQIKPITTGVPQFIRALPNGNFLVLNGPNATGLEVISATSAGVGCPPVPLPPPPPPPAIQLPLTSDNTVGPLVDFNQGPLLATQFLISTDGSAAYVVPQNFSSVFSYNVLTGGKTGIALSGGSPPTTGGLTSDNALLYVGSTDGLVHALNTGFLNDTTIIPVSNSTSPPTSMCSISTTTQVCNPDFVVMKP